MSPWKKALALTLLTATSSGYGQCVSTWVGATGSQNWNVSTNWDPMCIPGTISATDSATFSSSATGPTTVSLDAPIAIDPTLNQLIFSSSTNSFTISTAMANFIQFNGTTSSLQDMAGSHTISAPIQLNGTVLNAIVSDPSGVLLTQAGITDLSISSIVMNGPGEFRNVNTIILNGNFTVVSGTASNLNTIGNSITIAAQDFSISNGTLNNINSNAVSGVTGAILEGAGTLTISGGTLNNSNTGPATTTAEGSSSSFGNVTIDAGSLNNTNSAAITGGSTGSSFVTASPFILNNGTVTNFNSGSVDSTSFGSFMAVPSLIINGGLLTNSGSGTVASGGFGSVIVVESQMDVNGGKLVNDDTVRSSAVNVGPGGTVAGIGNFFDASGGTTVPMTNSGTVAPGDSPGTMTINGTYTQTSSGTLLISLFDASIYSSLVVNGTSPDGMAFIDGTLETTLAPGGTIDPSDTFVILDTANGVTGTFSQLVNTIPNLTPIVQYLPTSVLLSFDPILASYAAGYRETIFTSVNQTNFRIGRQLVQMRECFMYSEKECKEQCSTTCRRGKDNPWNFYFGPTADSGSVYTKKLQTGFSYWGAGALLGFDYAFANFGVGLMVDYNHIEADAHRHGEDFDIDRVHGSLYATYVPESLTGLAINAIIGDSNDWFDFKRKTGSSNELSTKGNPKGGEFDALLGIEYTFTRQISCGCLEIAPLASLQYIYLEVDAYSERGADLFNLTILRQHYDSLRSTLGARINFTREWRDITWTPEIDMGWQREYQDKRKNIRFSSPAFPSLDTATINTEASGRNNGFVGFDLLAAFDCRYALEASYDFIWNSLYHDHSFYFGFNLGF